MNHHIQETHFLKNKKAQYVDVVKNKDTQVISAVLARSNMRKTFFPDDMVSELQFDNKINELITHGNLLYADLQLSNVQGRRVEYRTDGSHKVLYGIVKNKAQDVPTVYPILRYISQQELAGKKDTDRIYLATRVEANKTTNVFGLVKDIKDASRDGIYLGISQDVHNQPTYLVDISQIFPQVFYNESVQRGSLTVQTDWINPRR
jgi:hypothetical protein